MTVGDAGLGPTVGRRVDAGDTTLVALVRALFGPAAIVEGGAVRHDVRGLRALLVEEAARALDDGAPLVVVNAATEPRRRARTATDVRTFHARLARSLAPPPEVALPDGRTLHIELRPG